MRLMAVMVREAGKTLDNALGDVREAVDFLRYYAGEARRLFAGPVALKGPTGETNTLELRGRGPFACISPWNFPLAIFTGQVAAALAAGNPVLAKPAEQTPIMAYLATKLLHEAGVPGSVLHLLPGTGAVGAALVKDPRVAGVVFTGSNDTGWAISAALAARRGALVPFIAETGGLNAMIADSSALPEQVIRDVVRSAFDSAGQRCSAARLLFVQEDVAGAMIDMLVGAVEALDIGDPLDYATDIGPVIDADAKERLEAHKARMRKEARELVDLPLPDACAAGTYVAPAVYEIDDAGVLEEEVFGPILHVVRFQGGHLDRVIDAINATRLRPHARPAQPHRGGRRFRRRASPRRQPLRQPQPDRRRGRRAALRRRGPVRHRPQGRRSQLSSPLRHRARAHHRHHRDRGQCRAAGAGDGVRPYAHDIAAVNAGLTPSLLEMFHVKQ